MGDKRRRVDNIEDQLDRMNLKGQDRRAWGEVPPAPPEGASAVAVARHKLAVATAAVEVRHPDPGSPFPKDWSPELKRAMLGDPEMRAANRDLLRAIRRDQTNIRAREPGQGEEQS